MLYCNNKARVLFFLFAFPYLASVHRVVNLHVGHTFVCIVLLLSLHVSHSCLLIASLHLSFSLRIFSLQRLLQCFSSHGLTISVSLILFSHLCLPRVSFRSNYSVRDIKQSLWLQMVHNYSRFELVDCATCAVTPTYEYK